MGLCRNGEYDPVGRIDAAQLALPGLDIRGLAPQDDDLRRMQQLLESVEQADVRMRILFDHGPGSFQGLLSYGQVACFTQEVSHALEDKGGYAVSSRRGVIAE